MTYACPKCESHDLSVIVTVEVPLIQHDNGEIETDSPDSGATWEWDEHSLMRCGACAYASEVQHFKTPELPGISTEAYAALVAEFDKMVERHDLTYNYSDDGRVYNAGRASADRLMEFHKTNLRWADARRIWNKWCDKKLVASEAPRWHWPEQEPGEPFREKSQ